MQNQRQNQRGEIIKEPVPFCFFQPILGTKSRPAGPLPDMTLEENMTVVVQPNVITRDQKAGVQVGELIRITRMGFERLHKAPRGLFRVG